MVTVATTGAPSLVPGPKRRLRMHLAAFASRSGWIRLTIVMFLTLNWRLLTKPTTALRRSLARDETGLIATS